MAKKKDMKSPYAPNSGMKTGISSSAPISSVRKVTAITVLRRWEVLTRSSAETDSWASCAVRRLTFLPMTK